MASTSSLPNLGFDQLVSALKGISEAKHSLLARSTDRSEAERQTLQHLDDSILLISKKINVWIRSTGAHSFLPGFHTC